MLSIIIINYNSKDVLEDCLLSLVNIKIDIGYEVFVTDNASSESIKEFVVKFPQFKFIFNEKNSGFAAANNIGIKRSSGDYILLLNPDTIVNENSFQPMIDYLKKHDDAGAVGCKIFNVDGEIERSTHSFPSLLKEFVHANEFIKRFLGYENNILNRVKTLLRLKSLESYWDHNSTKEVDHVTGACMMVKRDVIQKVGLLDEAFFLYNEEVEWSMRIKNAGYKIVFHPESNIIHLFGHSTKQKVQQQTMNNLLLERYRGMFYFFQKHYSKVDLMLLRLIVIEGFFFRFCSKFFKLIFASAYTKSDTKKEIIIINKIMGLAFKSNFDWRSE
jgi:GT2 family glycosyltransferase